MMQNGFRRIALAQGLLPERPASRETPVPIAPAAGESPDAAPAPGPPDHERDQDGALRT